MSDPLQDEKTLPLQVFTTAAALLDMVDKKVVISLRDGRTLLGILRSFDSFGNIVLQDSIERIYVDQAYAEAERGSWILRGENIALIGEFYYSKEEVADALLQKFERISFDDAQARLDEKQRKEQDEYRSTRSAWLKHGLDPQPPSAHTF